MGGAAPPCLSRRVDLPASCAGPHHRGRVLSQSHSHRSYIEMPILTPTEGGLDLEAGFYPATLTKIEQRAGETPSIYTGEVEDYLRWYLDIDEGTEGQEYWATTSAKLGPRCRARKWIRALGFEVTPGVGFDTEDLHGTRVIVEVGPDDAGTMKFQNIGPERRKRPATAGAKPKRAPVADDEEEEEFV